MSSPADNMDLRPALTHSIDRARAVKAERRLERIRSLCTRIIDSDKYDGEQGRGIRLLATHILEEHFR